VSYLAERLPPLEKVDSDMWIDEAIWGHMLYDEQTPWLIYLEFLNVFLDQKEKGHAFNEFAGYNRLKYWATWRLELRNILFNNPKLAQIRAFNTNDQARWREWHKSMSRSGGLDLPDFTYLEKRFHNFDDFADVVELLRGTGIESASNKRWTSKYVFPYGKDCVFEDLDQNARTNDRHFFRRTGELLYLIFCRSTRKEELLAALTNQFNANTNGWNKIVNLLQPATASPKGAERANAFLPYPFHPSYDEVTSDWLCILKLGMPGFDALPHLVNLAAFHFIQYQLRVARDVVGLKAPFKIVCEIVAPKKTWVRELSCDLYQENNLLSTRAVMAYIDDIESSEEWQHAKIQTNSFSLCKQILENRVIWPENYERGNNPDDLINTLRSDAKSRHLQHVAHIHRNYGREIGLVSKRGTVKLRYAPNDDFLKSLIFANVPTRMELHQFLALLWQRYALIFGDREAEEVLPRGEFEKKAFKANTGRLEQRLSSLGLLKRLSDGCAYVLNPYARSDT
jgi:hypothetical protein